MRLRLLLSVVLLAACGGSETNDQPLSVRGWITDVAGAKTAETYEQEIARRTTLFTSTSLWVENAEQASGGIAENGAFVVLDVPHGSPTLGFNAPGAEEAKIVLENVPGGADVFIPNVVLKNGGATVLDPKAILIRVPSDVDQARANGQMATVAGYPVRVIETPFAQMGDRRDYPNPGGFRPVAKVK
jgi:hypothetical protein